MQLSPVNPMDLKEGDAFAYGNTIYLLKQDPSRVDLETIRIVAIDTNEPGGAFRQVLIRPDPVFPVRQLKISGPEGAFTYGFRCATFDGFSRIVCGVLTKANPADDFLTVYSTPTVLSSEMSEEERADIARVFSNTNAVQTGDILVVDGVAYTADLLGTVWPCGVLIRGIA